MGESLSKATSQKRLCTPFSYHAPPSSPPHHHPATHNPQPAVDAATLAMLRDAHARICAYPTHRVSATVAVGALGSTAPDAADEKERGHAGFTKTQLAHCLRDTSPPRVDAAAAQRLFALLAGAKKKVHFTPFAAAYYTATADAAARPHALFLLCDLAGAGTVTADGVRLWLDAGGVPDAAAAATAFIAAAAGGAGAEEGAGVDEAAFVAALGRTDVAAGAGLCAALQSVAARLTTGVRAPAEGACASEGVLSPRTSRTDDEPATPSAGSVDAPHEHRKGAKKDKKSKSKKLRHRESAINVSAEASDAAAPAAAATTAEDSQSQQQEQQEQQGQQEKQQQQEKEKEGVVVPASGITEDFSDDEEELARRKPIAFVIRSADAAPAASVDMASHALKPPAMSMSLRVTSRGKARGSVCAAFAGSPGAESPASQTPSPAPGTPNVSARAGSTLDASTVFGAGASSSTPAPQGSTDFFAAAAAAPVTAPTAAAAPAQGAAQPFDMASMFGSSISSSISSSSATGTGSDMFGDSAKAAVDGSAASALFGDAKQGGGDGGATAGQTSLFDSTVFGSAGETPAAGATSFFGDAPFGTAQAPADADVSASFFGSASGPFGAAAPADASKTTEEAKDKDEKADDSAKDASQPETQPTQSSNSSSSSTDAPTATTSPEGTAPQTNPFDDLSMFGVPAENKSSTPAVDLFGTQPAESTPAATPAATPEKKSDNPFFDLSSFGITPQPAATATATTASSASPAPAAAPATAAAAPEDNPFADATFDAAPKPGLSPDQHALLDGALASFDAGRFADAAHAFRALCAQLRPAHPAALAVAARYHVAAAALQHLATAVPRDQALADVPADARDRLARVAAALVALRLHPVHRRAVLAAAAVFSDYAYAAVCRASDASHAAPAVAVRLGATCPACHEATDPTLPRCLACGAAAEVTADTLEPVTAENVARLRRCVACACRFAQHDTADALCPVCGGTLQ